jgi:hypothetical protein
MVGAALKVGADTVGERGGFADVEQFAGLVFKEVHARIIGQVIEFGLECVNEIHGQWDMVDGLRGVRWALGLGLSS